MGTDRPPPAITVATGLARHILANRPLRRRVLFQLTCAVMALLALGLATLGRITDHPWIMLVYWLGVMALTIGVFLLALWDLLAVRREERARQRGEG